MRRSSRDSLTYEDKNTTIHIEFHYNGLGEYEYCLPRNIVGTDRDDLIRKIEKYGQKKRYRIATTPAARRAD